MVRFIYWSMVYARARGGRTGLVAAIDWSTTGWPASFLALLIRFTTDYSKANNVFSLNIVYTILWQARKIAPVFQLQPTTVYLVNEFDNVAVFLHETSGRFNRSLIDHSAVYAVHGEEVTGSTSNSPSRAVNLGAGALTPFGAYTGPTLQVPPPRPQLSLRRRPTTFRKTVAVVSLSLPSSSKPSTSKASAHLEYNVVTQVVVTLEVGRCSPVNVAELVNQQVGFQVVLLDSKCFPILESDTTTGTDYWKSNRKILAASGQKNSTRLPASAYHCVSC